MSEDFPVHLKIEYQAEFIERFDDYLENTLNFWWVTEYNEFSKEGQDAVNCFSQWIQNYNIDAIKDKRGPKSQSYADLDYRNNMPEPDNAHLGIEYQAEFLEKFNRYFDIILSSWFVTEGAKFSKEGLDAVGCFGEWVRQKSIDAIEVKRGPKSESYADLDYRNKKEG